MSTPTQPETLTLERTLEGLQLVINLKEMWDRIPEEDQELVHLLKSALHHLEAGRTCDCESFLIAVRDGFLQIRNSVPSIAGFYIQLCPWCGGTVPTPSSGEPS